MDNTLTHVMKRALDALLALELSDDYARVGSRPEDDMTPATADALARRGLVTRKGARAVYLTNEGRRVAKELFRKEEESE